MSRGRKKTELSSKDGDGEGVTGGTSSVGGADNVGGDGGGDCC